MKQNLANAQSSVICIPGWGFTPAAFGPLGEYFHSHAVRVEHVPLYELASVKGSISDENTASRGVPPYADRLAARLMRLRGHRSLPMSLVGWSTGAIVCAECAVRYPELVASLVLIGFTPSYCERVHCPWGTPLAVVRAMRRRVSMQRQRTLDDFFRLVYGGLGDESVQELEVQRALHAAECITTAQLVEGLQYLTAADLSAILCHITAPTFLLHGTADKVVSVKGAEYAEQAISSASLEVFSGAGHALALSHAIAVARSIERFWGSVHG